MVAGTIYQVPLANTKVAGFAVKDLTLVRLINSFAVKSLENVQDDDTQILHNLNANTS